MNSTVRFALLSGLVLGLSTVLSAQAVVPVAGHALSLHELKKEIAEAHTPEQYNVLALYFRQREQIFRKKAADEKVEWERRKLAKVGMEMKFPSPTDSARNLYDYYAYEADQMAHRAIEYEVHTKQIPPAVK